MANDCKLANRCILAQVHKQVKWRIKINLQDVCHNESEKDGEEVAIFVVWQYIAE